MRATAVLLEMDYLAKSTTKEFNNNNNFSRAPPDMDPRMKSKSSSDDSIIAENTAATKNIKWALGYRYDCLEVLGKGNGFF